MASPEGKISTGLPSVLGEKNRGSNYGIPNLSTDAIKIIRNCYSFLLDLKPKMTAFTNRFDPTNECPINFNNIHKLCSNICGVSTTTVGRYCKKENVTSKPVMKNSKKPKILCDSFTIAEIRRVTLGFYVRKEFPTVKEIRNKCLEDQHFPRVGKSTFRKWMVEKCNFKYKKMMKKPVYLERTDIAAHRESYLRNISRYRELGYTIYFCDETWASPEQSRNKCWQILLNNAEIQEFKQLYRGKVLQDVKGWTGGFVVKGGNGRVIVNHIGCEDGFVDGAQDVFISQKDSRDYHRSMNAEHYLEWFTRLLELLPEKSVIVIDQAPYHRKREPDTYMPNMSWRKADIITYLLCQNADVPETVLSFDKLNKSSLIQLSKKYPVEPKYIIETLIGNSGKDIHILWLPVAHCELNPIELIWAYVKGIISTNNTGGIQQVHELSLQALESVTPQLWKKCVEHVVKVEKEFWVRDRLVELSTSELMENQIIIERGENSSDESSEGESEISDDEMNVE